MHKPSMILEQILDELRANNADKRLWGVTDIANYLNLSESSIRTRVICKPDFPVAVSIPTDAGQTNRRWYPHEVKDWIGKHRENSTIRRGRPRSVA